MEISASSSVDIGVTYDITRASGSSSVDGAGQKQEVAQLTGAPASDSQAKPDPLRRKDLDKLTEEMNHFMEAINTNIQFKLHEKTHQLFVQVIDQRDHKVLKEFPPHQLLDTIAAIRDRIGVLLDEKA